METDNVLCSVFTKYMYQAQSVFFECGEASLKQVKNQISKREVPNVETSIL